MLAAHLQRLARREPVRYAAMDPAHLRAIQQWLQLRSRGLDIPRIHTLALEEPGSPLPGVYQNHPHALEAYQHFMHSGDPGALMAYLGSLEDADYSPSRQEHYLSHELPGVLSVLHGQAMPGSPDAQRVIAGRRTTDPELRQSLISAIYSGGMSGYHGTIGNIIDRLAHTMSTRNNFRAHYGNLRAHGDPLSLIPMADTASALRQYRPHVEQHGQGVSGNADAAIRHLINSVVVPGVMQS